MLSAGEGIVVVEENCRAHAFPNHFIQSALMHQVAQVYTRPANISRCNQSLVSDQSIAHD